MKIPKLILMLLLCSLTVFAQKKKTTNNKTKEPNIEETQNWIKSVIQTYGTGELVFQNLNIIYDDPYGMAETNLQVKDETETKQLSGTKIVEEGNFKAVYLSCFKGKCVKTGFKTRNSSGDFDYSYLDKFRIQLDKDIPNDICTRLLKAFSHLIKLRGGKVIDETF